MAGLRKRKNRENAAADDPAADDDDSRGRVHIEVARRAAESGVAPEPTSVSVILRSRQQLRSLTSALPRGGHLLFQLDSFFSADFTDEALDRYDHILFERRVVAPIIPVGPIDDRRVFVDQASAVDHHHVPVRNILVRNPPATLGEVSKGHSRLQELAVCQHLLLRNGADRSGYACPREGKVKLLEVPFDAEQYLVRVLSGNGEAVRVFLHVVNKLIENVIPDSVKLEARQPGKSVREIKPDACVGLT